jgi:conjugal transfer mating pair stabilization protein TraG
MRVRLRRKLKRWLKKGLKNRKVVFTTVLLCFVVVIFAAKERGPVVDSASCRPLLDLIARAESKGNYNAYFGNVRNSKIDFTSMAVGEVLEWQAEFVSRGNASSAVGKYQFINTTLAGLVRELNIPKTERFSPALQDRLAMALIERRGVGDYVSGKLSREAFAGNLAKEWASLPSVIGRHPDKSYYASDGLNVALVSVREVLKAIEPIRSA